MTEEKDPVKVAAWWVSMWLAKHFDLIRDKKLVEIDEDAVVKNDPELN